MVRTRSKRRHVHLSSLASPRADWDWGGWCSLFTGTGWNDDTAVIKTPPSEETSQLINNQNSTLGECTWQVRGGRAVGEGGTGDRPDLGEKNRDMDSLLDLVNKAFTSLDGLQADYENLYKVVEDFIVGKMLRIADNWLLDWQKLQGLSHKNQLNQWNDC